MLESMKVIRNSVSGSVKDADIASALDKILGLIETVEVLKEIRRQYEKKFGIRMFANGSFEEIKEEA